MENKRYCKAVFVNYLQDWRCGDGDPELSGEHPPGILVGGDGDPELSGEHPPGILVCGDGDPELSGEHPRNLPDPVQNNNLYQRTLFSNKTTKNMPLIDLNRHGMTRSLISPTDLGSHPYLLYLNIFISKIFR